jgi:hypothetical protein
VNAKSRSLVGGNMLLSCLILAGAATPAAAQEGPRAARKQAVQEQQEPKYIIRVYPVDDLLITYSDYPFSASLDPFENRDGRTTGAGATGVGGGMGGMGGGGMGGGMFSVPAKPASAEILRQFGGGGGAAPGAAQSTQPAIGGGMGGMGTANVSRSVDRLHRNQMINGLVNLIKNVTGNEDDWTDDQRRRPQFFDNNLVIRQTEAVHEQVADLLQSLRSAGSTSRSVRVDATWLLLDTKQRAALVADADASASSKPMAIDRKQFKELARETAPFHGQIICLNGQKVHFATGRRRVVSIGATPTVGVAATGYTPNTKTLNIGAAFQVTPSVSKRRRTASVDLQSSVTQWYEPGPPIKVTSQRAVGSTEKSVGGPLVSDTVSVDRVSIGMQEWATTVQIPINTPVLVGSVSLTNSDDKGNNPFSGEHPELALVIEVREE